ncbi:PREDICTED: uncharacterized protein LOC105315246 [Amphimedon queenslandica]|uniref:Uncharacterized protein n=1 Tax=Amphimedon queenslandica TaxID=400682 RepID=A0A1X7T7L0_AMPQE|nr:PREDICTED: uncharacterized protein LOC105315246 [Amphimedon queenslandica]|eukprot:XP_011408116.1 PREDICTED: uncharacterized protein LOC105315246 [Amphimedon queenslandica]
MRKANKVLMEKVNAYKSGTTPVIDTPRLSPSVRKPQHPLPPSIAERPGFTIAPVVQSDGDGMLVVSKTEGITPAHHTDSDSVPDDSPAFISKEEMARMFKSYNQQGSSDWSQSPQQVEDSSLAAQKVQPTEESLVAEQKRQELARKADDALLEVDRMRRQADLKQKPVHQQTNNDSDTQDESRPKGQLTKEIEEMADEVRKASRGPNTDEVIFNDDPNDDRPYDPNLVCPRCGKQYRVGEIQKLRRHINEFCTGIR